MPYKSRNRKRKTAYNMAKKALKKVNKMSSAVETKHYDLDFETDQECNYVGNFLFLNLPDQGVEDTDRVGDSIKMAGLRLKFSLNIDGADRALCRFIVMIDKQNEFTVASQFLATTGNENVINSPYLVDERHKYTILSDKVYPMNIGAYRIRQINLSQKLNKKTQYTGGTTAITKNAIKFWFFSDYPVADPDAPLIKGWSRLWYKDA